MSQDTPVPRSARKAAGWLKVVGVVLAALVPTATVAYAVGGKYFVTTDRWEQDQAQRAAAELARVERDAEKSASIREQLAAMKAGQEAQSAVMKSLGDQLRSMERKLDRLGDKIGR